MDKLGLLSKTPAPHVVFGIFNLTWPGIAMWTSLIVFFALAIWLRIPEFMESDMESRESDMESRDGGCQE